MSAPPDYQAFLTAKARSVVADGIAEPTGLPGAMFPFQRDLVTWALRRGRAAIFAGTGLGKTLMQLAWADAVVRMTGQFVLILTPLAVAEQTVREAARFGIRGVTYASDWSQATGRIVVTNYDRIDKFKISHFGGIVLDESSIIKSHDSKTRKALTEACKGIRFKLACTATPAPNDWTELGTHAEFLDVLSEKEMLAMYFVHDGSVRAHGDSEWRLKGHATEEFWRWVASWGAMVRSPSDLGYDDDRYRLPPLVKHQVTVAADYRPMGDLLFPCEANTLQERLSARRNSVVDRCEAAARIVNAQPDRPWMIWCHLNAEADALAKLIPDMQEVRGTDKPDVRASRLLGFCDGKPRVLLSKPSVAGWGMNWQHCADMVFVGLSDSFEQVFQSIRRCWRFGQTKPVNVYMIASELEGAVVKNLDAKELAFETMGASMAAHMRDLVRRNVQGDRKITIRSDTQIMELPSWMAA